MVRLAVSHDGHIGTGPFATGRCPPSNRARAMREVVGFPQGSTEALTRPRLGRRSTSKARWSVLLVPITAAVVAVWSGLLFDPILWSGTTFLTLGTAWLLPHIAHRRHKDGRT